MKRVVSLGLSVLLIVVIFCGCFDGESALKTEYKAKIENSDISYPLYDRLSDEDKNIYTEMCVRIENHSKNSIYLGIYDTEDDADEAVRNARNILYQLAYEHPDYFWVDPYTCMLNKYNIFGKYYVSISIVYIIDEEETADKKEIFDKKVDEILKIANENNLLFDKLLSIYDAILSGAEYDRSIIDNKNTDLLERNAYGCLVEGKTICSGYSMAFNLFMQKLGLECGVEFNNYDFSLETEDSHVWNYCKLDGEYYYFDPTWDDTLFEDERYKPYIEYSHIYFAVNKDELSKSNLTMLSEVPTPSCEGIEYNYFIYKNQNISEYSFDAAKSVILEQDENKYVELRFDTPDQLLKAEDELMLQGYIYLILDSKENIRYVISDSGLHMYIFFD